MNVFTAPYLEVIIYKGSRINQKTWVNVPSFFWLWYEMLITDYDMIWKAFMN